MNPDLQAFVLKHGHTLLAAITVVASVGLIQWGRIRRAELLSASLSGDDPLELAAHIFHRPIVALPPLPRKGLLDQFSQLRCVTQVLIVFFLGTSPVVMVLIVCVTLTSASHHSMHRMMVERQMMAAMSQHAISQSRANPGMDGAVDRRAAE